MIPERGHPIFHWCRGRNVSALLFSVFFFSLLSRFISNKRLNEFRSGGQHVRVRLSDSLDILYDNLIGALIPNFLQEDLPPLPPMPMVPKRCMMRRTSSGRATILEGMRDCCAAPSQ